MKSAKVTTISDAARVFCSLGTTIKSLKIKQINKITENSKTQLRYEMKLKFQMNK